MPQNTLLSLQHLHKERAQGDGYTLHIEHFFIGRGERVALVGPSGCGKSTALDIMAAILQPEEHVNKDLDAHFFFKEHNILTLWKKRKRNALAQLRQAYIGYILQTGGLLPFLSGHDNICVASPHATKDDIYTIADALDIRHLLRKKPAQMSVGERQRFAIARALIHNPELILADEPVASLDPLNADKVMSLFVSLAQQKDIAIVMVSHAPDAAKAAGFTLVPLALAREDGHIRATLTRKDTPSSSSPA